MENLLWRNGEQAMHCFFDFSKCDTSFIFTFCSLPCVSIRHFVRISVLTLFSSRKFCIFSDTRDMRENENMCACMCVCVCVRARVYVREKEARLINIHICTIKVWLFYEIDQWKYKAFSVLRPFYSFPLDKKWRNNSRNWIWISISNCYLKWSFSHMQKFKLSSICLKFFISLYDVRHSYRVLLSSYIISFFFYFYISVTLKITRFSSVECNMLNTLFFFFFFLVSWRSREVMNVKIVIARMIDTLYLTAVNFTPLGRNENFSGGFARNFRRFVSTGTNDLLITTFAAVVTFTAKFLRIVCIWRIRFSCHPGIPHMWSSIQLGKKTFSVTSNCWYFSCMRLWLRSIWCYKCSLKRSSPFFFIERKKKRNAFVVSSGPQLLSL